MFVVRLRANGLRRFASSVCFRNEAAQDVRVAARPRADFRDSLPSTNDQKMSNRRLTNAEFALARWMLENGTSEGRKFLSQLDIAEVTPWQCPCGCASIKFYIEGQASTRPEVHVLGDYHFGPVGASAGAFIFECGGVLGGIEVYELAGEPPSDLPQAPLRSF